MPQLGCEVLPEPSRSSCVIELGTTRSTPGKVHTKG